MDKVEIWTCCSIIDELMNLPFLPNVFHWKKKKHGGHHLQYIPQYIIFVCEKWKPHVSWDHSTSFSEAGSVVNSKSTLMSGSSSAYNEGNICLKGWTGSRSGVAFSANLLDVLKVGRQMDQYFKKGPDLWKLKSNIRLKLNLSGF